MIDFKSIIAKAISEVVNINETEIAKSIEKPKEQKMEIIHFHVLD